MTRDTLLAWRASRRSLLKGGVALGVALAFPGCSRAATGTALASHRGDSVATADGYTHDVVLRWGDPLFTGVPSLEAVLAGPGGLLGAKPDLAARWFGYNCDAVHFFPLDGSPTRGIVCVNHEYTNEELFLPDTSARYRSTPQEIAAYLRRHPGVAMLTQSMHGVTVTTIERRPGGAWRHVPGTPVARRITVSTPCVLVGPARGHPLLRTAADPAGHTVLGTLANCAGGQTPWGSFLAAEENVQDYFSNAGALASAEPGIRQAHRRWPGREASTHGWEHVDPRFDLARNPTEMLRFGWIVEVDPYDPLATPFKRTALGRFQHECAATALARDGRLAIYSGDDARFEYVYKFVTEERVHPADRTANRDLLDRGTLYVARFDADGSGRWLALRHGEGPLIAANGFEGQGDVLIRTREAADLLGATPMDRPEDIAPDSGTGRVFIALTNNHGRQPAPARATHNGREVDVGPNAANPRGPNFYGHVIELNEEGGDTAATRFAWRIFLSGGDDAPGDSFGSPDNLALGADGNLWIVTDGAQPGGGNNGCFVVPARGPEAGRARQVMSGPPGSEIAGCAFTADGSALLLSIMHPGSGGSLAAPQSSWPDGPGHLPRPSVIALRRQDGGVM